MKILHFIHGLNTGGAETLVKNYMLNFDKNDHDVLLLCLSHNTESPYEKVLADNHIKVIYVEDYLWPKCRNGFFVRIFKRFQRYLLVKIIIKKEKPDILHTHLSVNRFVKFARPSKKTVVFHTIHSDPKKIWQTASSKCRRDLKSAKWLVKKYNMQLIVLHTEMKEQVDEIFGINSRILNNGIDVALYKNLKQKKSIKKDLNIPKDVFVVGHVGRFSEVKNHEFLTKIFKKISDKRYDVFLLMVGDGPEKTKIKNKMRNYGLIDKCLILSNRDDIPVVLNAMDVFVFPSFYEGMPTSLIEAQEAKIPCFVSDSVTESATISNLVTRLSLDDGAEKWAEIIENYRKPERIIINDKDWDIKKITRQLENIYEDALTEKKNGKK
ncbi:glycosyltransferase [Candidatus Saccharibacteria bacterium]|nr:glycosyltransferase [Candidatus Saccharibacteria bacterium]